MSSNRLRSVDLLRGLVMIVMALDHARDYLASTPFNPTDLTQTTAPLFLTRWITHFCAPVFVFLAGTSAFLSHKPRPELARFLASRGLWLVFLEITVVHIGWEFTAAYHFLLLQVIWAIGWSMIGLAVLVFLPPRVVALIGIAIIAGHNLLDPVEGGVLFTLAFGHRRYQLDPQHLVVVGYAVIPWLGVMAAGYGFGELLERPDRRRWVAGLGVALTLAFIALRLVNRYGDPEAWSRQSSPLFTVFSFVNCTKYPPSLDYVLMTLGPALMLLSLLERVEWKPIEIFGRVPLFYYVLHIYLLHAIGLIPALLHHGMGVLPMGVFGVPSDGGIGLPATYAIWIAAVLALYPLCRWYAGFKSRRRDLVWLSYL